MKLHFDDGVKDMLLFLTQAYWMQNECNFFNRTKKISKLAESLPSKYSGSDYSSVTSLLIDRLLTSVGIHIENFWIAFFCYFICGISITLKINYGYLNFCVRIWNTLQKISQMKKNCVIPNMAEFLFRDSGFSSESLNS